jgi:hypothetical protein
MNRSCQAICSISARPCKRDAIPGSALCQQHYEIRHREMVKRHRADNEARKARGEPTIRYKGRRL